MSIVYLIHFSNPIGDHANPRGQAQHYIGFTDSLKKRLAAHQAGNGSAIMAAVAAAGVEWKCVRTWPQGTRGLERKLKNRHNAWRLCPICKEARKNEHDEDDGNSSGTGASIPATS